MRIRNLVSGATLFDSVSNLSALSGLEDSDTQKLSPLTEEQLLKEVAQPFLRSLLYFAAPETAAKMVERKYTKMDFFRDLLIEVLVRGSFEGLDTRTLLVEALGLWATEVEGPKKDALNALKEKL